MFYSEASPWDNAGWYDPSLGRFAQADSIVPGGVQGLDRYAYANNNPPRFTDPSGHVTCQGTNWDDGPQCTKKSEFWHTAIQSAFNWKAASDFSMNELKTIYRAGANILAYVDRLTNGKGSMWMNKYLGGTTFDHGLLFGHPFTTGSAIHMYKDMSASWITHELGHVWDNRTSSDGNGIMTGGGASDYLNEFLWDGNPYASIISRVPFSYYRWVNPNSSSYFNPYIPVADRWLQSGPTYGNGATVDYFAETFRWNVLGQQNIVPSKAGAWVNSVITLEANLLP